MIPENIIKKLCKLHEICEKYPDAIPVSVVAEYLGKNSDTIRSSMREGTCPYGYAWNIHGRAGFCIPTIKFYLWITNGKGSPDE